MILHDISRGVFSGAVYEDDPQPEKILLNDIDKGDIYTLSQLKLTPHTGTHIDFPAHFVVGGETADDIDPKRFFGKCTVVTIEGILTGEDMEQLLPFCSKNVLFHGNRRAFISSSAAEVIAESEINLVGTDAMSIAPPFDEFKTHYTLLKNSILILEGVNLSLIKDGDYLLSAFPIKIEGAEASLCRAILMEQEKGL